MNVLVSRYDKVVSRNVYCILLERSRWRSGDVNAIQIELAAVAGAPYALQIVSVLNRAVQVCAHGRESPIVASRSAHENPWPAAEFENLRRIGLQLLHGAGENVV